MTDRHPFDRHPDETPPAWAAFQTYLQQGPGRSVTKVAEECHKNRSLIGRWSARHHWQRRADAWDAHLTTEYRAEVIAAQRTLAHRHLDLSHKALAAVSAAVSRLSGPGVTLTVPEAVRLWEIAARTERAALQLASPRAQGTEGPAGDPGGWTDEERTDRLAQLRDEIQARLNDLPETDPDEEETEEDPWPENHE